MSWAINVAAVRRTTIVTKDKDSVFIACFFSFAALSFADKSLNYF